MTLLIGAVVYFATTAKDPFGKDAATQRPPVAPSAKQLPADLLGECHVGEDAEQIVRGFCPNTNIAVNADGQSMSGELIWANPGFSYQAPLGYEWQPHLANSNPQWRVGLNAYDSIPGETSLVIPPLPSNVKLVCRAFFAERSGKVWTEPIPGCGSSKFSGVTMPVGRGIGQVVLYMYDPRRGFAAPWAPTMGDKSADALPLAATR